MKRKQRRSDWWNKAHTPLCLTSFAHSSATYRFLDCQHVSIKPLHSISKELLPCMCVCVSGRGTLSCEQKGFAQTYCMIKLWLYFSPLLMPLLILLQLHFTHLFSNMLDTFCFDLLLSCRGAAPLCELINMLFFKNIKWCLFSFDVFN